MKVRIKKTGEIEIVCDYSRIQVEDCDSYGNPKEYKLDEIEIIQDEPNQEREERDWEEIRIKAAIAAMQGIISNAHQKDYRHGTYCEYKDGSSDIAKQSVYYANALLKQLKNKENESE